MRLIEKFNNLKTREEKRLFALKHVTDNKIKKLLSYDLISTFTISAMFYKSQGETYKIKRNYTATFKDNKQY